MPESLDEGETEEVVFHVEEELMSDTEQDVGDNDDSDNNYGIQHGPRTFIGKYKTSIWSNQPIPRHGRTKKENILK